jgi:hypothetical protein
MKHGPSPKYRTKTRSCPEQNKSLVIVLQDSRNSSTV